MGYNANIEVHADGLVPGDFEEVRRLVRSAVTALVSIARVQIVETTYTEPKHDG